MPSPEAFRKAFGDTYILDDEGNPVIENDFLAAIMWRVFNEDRMQLAKYQEGGVFVSTVFIGQSRIIFETMVFGGKRDGYTDRYETRAAALAGHEAAVALVKAALVKGEHK